MSSEGVENFDPSKQYGQYVVVTADGVEDAKEKVLEHSKYTVPEKYRDRIVILVNDYDPIMAEYFFGIKEPCVSVAWKYSPNH